MNFSFGKNVNYDYALRSPFKTLILKSGKYSILDGRYGYDPLLIRNDSGLNYKGVFSLVN